MVDTPSLGLETYQDLTNTEDSLYWEKDDVNPNIVIYDLETDKVIIPESEDDMVTPLPEQEVKKFVIKNVGNTRYRNNR